MLKCAICNKEFKDNQLDEYAAHVQKCAAEESMKRKTEDMKKINEELEELKRAKCTYEGLRDLFKEKYPEIYEANFKDVCHCCSSNKDDKNKDESNDNDCEEFNYESFEKWIENIIRDYFGYSYDKRN